MSTKTPPSQTAGKRFIGQVEWFSERKGYGFIGWEEDKDVFVHRSAILSRGKILQEGQKVEFGVKRTPQGTEAINVIELPREAERAIDHSGHNLQVLSRKQAHHVKNRQRHSNPARPQKGPFVYSYTIRKR